MAKSSRLPSPEEHTRLWSQLDTGTRRQIVRAVNRGEALPNRKHARLAVPIARRQLRYWKYAWLLGPAIGLVAIPQGWPAVLVQGFLGALMMGGLSFFRFKRVQLAEQANLDVVEGRRRPPKETPEPPARRWRGRRARADED